MLNSEHKPNYSTSAGILPMPCCVQPGIEIYYADNAVVMPLLADESIDIICIDPPYLYLKGQKLERPFDEQKFFAECKRLLKKDGFIIMFGRGESFYRWNTLLADLGFVFKEEIIWNKSHCSSPLMNISRVHETISIFTKKNGTINKVKIPYLEMKADDVSSILQDIKRLKSILNNPKSLKAVEDFLINNNNGFDRPHTVKQKIQVEGHTMDRDRSINVINSMQNGFNEKTIIRTDRADCDTFTKFGINSDKRQTGDRATNVIQSIEFGLNEKTVIKEVRDHYSAIHPTQKPVRLIERLLALCVPKRKDILVADFFAGSMSTMEAVYNMRLKGIAVEIDEEYYNDGKMRLMSLPPIQCSLFD